MEQSASPLLNKPRNKQQGTQGDCNHELREKCTGGALLHSGAANLRMSLHGRNDASGPRREKNHGGRLPLPEGTPESITLQPSTETSQECGPFGTIHIFDGKLYLQTGKKKNVSKQLAVNGKTELCAMKGDEWIRLSGTLVNDDRREAKASMLDAYPSLKKMYSPDDSNTQVLYFKDATATIYSFSRAPIVIRF